MKLLKLAGIFLLLAATIACSNDESKPEPDTNFIINLAQPQTLTTRGGVFNGSFTGGDSNYLQAIELFWSLTPSVANQILVADHATPSLSSGAFTLTLNNEMLPGTTYYMIAILYTLNGENIISNEISFTTANSVFTGLATDILTTSAVLKGNLVQGENEWSYAGFVYDTNPNPTQNDSGNIVNVIGSDTFEIELSGLLPNTTYYARAIHQIIKNGVDYYTFGDEIQFRTTGYTGPAGGYVVYDKGESTDGWRYMEIYPQTVDYYTTETGAKWGENSFISGLYTQFGTGKANTGIIAANTSSANCAAKLCLNYTKNGYSDWFLGSVDEMLIITNALHKINIDLNGTIWTSSQYNETTAYMVYKQTGSGEYVSTATYQYKNLSQYVYPIRTY